MLAAVALAISLGPPASAAVNDRGYDISFPQCGGPYPPDPAFGIVGVSGGRAFDDNPCLADQYRWAQAAPGRPALYVNTGNPGTLSAHWGERGPKPCDGSSEDLGCAYNYGWNAARHAFAYARSQIGRARVTWWLDVETTNSWSRTNLAANLADITGAIDFLRSRKRVTVGIYSTRYQWGQITGGASLPSVPNWVAGARDANEAASFCDPQHSFTGGPVLLVQFPDNRFNGDLAC